MSDLRMTGSDGKEYTIREDQAIVQGEDGGIKVVDKPKVHEAATRRVDESYKKQLADVTELIRAQKESMDGMTQGVTRAIMDLKASADRLPLYDPANEPQTDTIGDAGSYQELMDLPPCSDLARDFQESASQVGIVYMLRKAFAEAKSGYRGGPLDQIDPSTIAGWKRFQRIKGLVDREVKRTATHIWSTGGTDSGTEWIPTGVASTYADIFRVPTAFTGWLNRIEMPDGVKTLHIPCFETSATTVIKSEVTGTTAYGTILYSGTVATPTSGYLTLTPYKQATQYVQLNAEMIEDSPAPVLEALRTNMIAAMREAHESGVINGQSAANANLDGANGPGNANGYGDTSGLTSGLRFYGIYTNANTADAGGSVCGLDHVEAAWKTMGNFGADVANCGIVGSAKCFFDLATDNVIKQYLYYGPGNTLPTGALAPVYGMPFFLTSQIPAMLATGKVGATGNNYTCAIIVNKSRWLVGMKRNLEVRMIPASNSLEDLVSLRAFARHGVGHYPPETDDHVAIVINVLA